MEDHGKALCANMSNAKSLGMELFQHRAEKVISISQLS